MLVATGVVLAVVGLGFRRRAAFRAGAAAAVAAIAAPKAASPRAVAPAGLAAVGPAHLLAFTDRCVLQWRDVEHWLVVGDEGLPSTLRDALR
jgi:hypothetical protein